MGLLFGILIVVASILMILVVLVQNPKGGGLSSTFGSASQFGGVRKTTDTLEKLTWYLAVGIVVIALLSAPYSTPQAQEKGQSEVSKTPARQSPDGLGPQVPTP